MNLHVSYIAEEIISISTSISISWYQEASGAVQEQLGSVATTPSISSPASRCSSSLPAYASCMLPAGSAEVCFSGAGTRISQTRRALQLRLYSCSAQVIRQQQLPQNVIFLKVLD
uniref:Uncharacterized protein n=1 Tax=Oryza brachyantha TaxID=4533 RepID=J3M2N5_ORYBR